jgi:HKD family nuclease
MTINFIGHGLPSKDNKTVGRYLISSFKDESFTKFLDLTAYATMGGIKNITPALKTAKSHLTEIKFFLGIDDQITSKEVFQNLIDLEIDCYAYHNLNKDVIFHPKIYIFEGDRKNRIIIGSSNLTGNGLFN